MLRAEVAFQLDNGLPAARFASESVRPAIGVLSGKMPDETLGDCRAVLSAVRESWGHQNFDRTDAWEKMNKLDLTLVQEEYESNDGDVRAFRHALMDVISTCGARLDLLPEGVIRHTIPDYLSANDIVHMGTTSKGIRHLLGEQLKSALLYNVMSYKGEKGEKYLAIHNKVFEDLEALPAVFRPRPLMALASRLADLPRDSVVGEFNRIREAAEQMLPEHQADTWVILANQCDFLPKDLRSDAVRYFFGKLEDVPDIKRAKILEILTSKLGLLPKQFHMDAFSIILDSLRGLSVEARASILTHLSKSFYQLPEQFRWQILHRILTASEGISQDMQEAVVNDLCIWRMDLGWLPAPLREEAFDRLAVAAVGLPNDERDYVLMTMGDLLWGLPEDRRSRAINHLLTVSGGVSNGLRAAVGCGLCVVLRWQSDQCRLDAFHLLMPVVEDPLTCSDEVSSRRRGGALKELAQLIGQLPEISRLAAFNRILTACENQRNDELSRILESLGQGLKELPEEFRSGALDRLLAVAQRVPELAAEELMAWLEEQR